MEVSFDCRFEMHIYTKFLREHLTINADLTSNTCFSCFCADALHCIRRVKRGWTFAKTKSYEEKKSFSVKSKLVSPLSHTSGQIYVFSVGYPLVVLVGQYSCHCYYRQFPW